MRRRLGLAGAVLLGSTAALAAPKAKPGARPRLPPPLEQSVQAHQALAQAAKQSPEALCKLVDGSYKLVNPLAIALGDLERGVDASKVPHLYDRLDKRVVGVYFALFDSATRVGVNYAQLAGMARGDDAALLQAMAELDGVAHGIENVPAWQEAMTDYGGCHAPARATPSLTALARSWTAASPCMRAALTRPLDELLEQMANDGNFCQGDPAERKRAAGANAAQMRKLAGTSAQKLADELLRRAAQSTNQRPRPPG